MPNFPGVRRLLRIAGTTRAIEREVDDEMRFHLQMRIEDLMRQGYSSDEAQRLAAREYGDLAAARAELASIDRRRARHGQWREWLASVAQDVRVGARGLVRRPVFTVTILITLAVGVGANAALFSVVDAVLLRALPFADPDRLVHLWETDSTLTGGRSEASYPDYLDWRARNRSFADLAGYQGGGFLLGGEQPTTVRGANVTWNFLDLLGVKPLIGRSFRPGEDDVGAPRVLLLCYGTWQTQFAGDPSVVGRSITLDGGPATIIGVLPADFQFARLGDAGLLTPISRPPSVRDNRGSHWVNVVGRLKPGVSIERAGQDMSGIMRGLARDYPATNTERTTVLLPLRDEFVGSIKPLLTLLYGAVIVVLLVACVNVANLLLIRGADREREIAVRVVLGAGRGRLVRQLLTESVLLALSGGVLGLLVAKADLSALVSLIPAAQLRRVPALGAIALDGRVVTYTLVMSLIAGIVFGMVPALRVSAASLAESMKSGGRGTTGAAGRVRDVLVVGEIALTVILMSGATLFGRSLARLASIDPGFKPSHLATMVVALPSRSYDEPRQAATFERLESRLREVPGVTNVGMISKLPLDPGNTVGFAVLGQPTPEPGHEPSTSYRIIDGDYFGTMGIPLVAGRTVNKSDDAKAPPVLVANRAFAARFLGAGDPVGKSIITGKDTLRVVGVVGDVPLGRLEEPVAPVIYLHFGVASQASITFVVRTQRDDAQLANELRRAIASVDPVAAMSSVTMMNDLITQSPSVFMRRFPLYLIAAFAATALLLAIVGIYGVVSYSVAQRTREMGIRMALGAQPAALVSLVVRHGVWMAAAGIVVGVTGALFAGRYAASMLYGVTASDPLTYAAVAMVLAGVAVAASVVPARRASKVDPALALRMD